MIRRREALAGQGTQERAAGKYCIPIRCGWFQPLDTGACWWQVLLVNRCSRGSGASGNERIMTTAKPRAKEPKAKTPGTIMAEKLRAESNGLSHAEREELL